MILVFDVGNTYTLLGVYVLEPQPKLLMHWKVSTDRQRTSDEWAILIRNLCQLDGILPEEIKALVISSVVPPIMPTLQRMSKQHFGSGPMVVGPGVKTGMPIIYENPKEVGADRIVNAVAAYEKYGGPLIIVDFGTATTFCAVSANGEYLGGAIAPGIMVSTEALFSRASKLPRIELVKPKRVIAKNTIQAMQSGIIYGFSGQVDGIVKKMRREFSSPPKVVATGELAELIVSESKTIDIVDSMLTLEGLCYIYLRQSAPTNIQA